MSPVRKGPVSQRELVGRLRILIDASMAPNSTAHKDIAKAKLRALLDTANWRTAYVMNQLSSRRCRYLSSIGYWTPLSRQVGEWHGKRPEASDDE